jgi:hypothetical protein
MVNYVFPAPCSKLYKKIRACRGKLFSGKIKLIIIFLVIIFILGCSTYYYLHSEEKINGLAKNTSVNIQQIKNLKNQLVSLQLAQKNNQILIKKINSDISKAVEEEMIRDKEVLGASDSASLARAIPLGVIRVNDNYVDPIAIYDSPLANYQVATSSPGTVFLFFEKEMGYYQVEMTKEDYKVGWIQSQFVTEIP